MIRKAFTLIELLVVITIIVILLALLTPALDNAIIASQMAVCGSNLKSGAAAAISYAHDNQRAYPKRQNRYNWDALMMKNSAHPFDILSMYERYTSLDVFVDPLLPETKLDDGNNHPETVVYSNYSVYSGWGVSTQDGLAEGFAMMDRLGDQFAWEPPGTDTMYRFNVLMADEDYRFPGQYTTASHPDDRGLMGVGRLQDQWTQPAVPATIPAVSYRATICWWVIGNTNGAVRGKLDTQFAYDDGAVQRFDEVEMFDERFAPLVVTGVGEYNQGRQAQVPAVNRGGASYD